MDCFILKIAAIGCPETSVTSNLCCVTSQKSKDLTYKNLRPAKLIVMKFFSGGLYKTV